MCPDHFHRRIIPTGWLPLFQRNSSVQSSLCILCTHTDPSKSLPNQITMPGKAYGSRAWSYNWGFQQTKESDAQFHRPVMVKWKKFHTFLLKMRSKGREVWGAALFYIYSNTDFFFCRCFKMQLKEAQSKQSCGCRKHLATRWLLWGHDKCHTEVGQCSSLTTATPTIRTQS